MESIHEEVIFNQVICHLETYIDEIVEIWYNEAKINQDDFYKDEIRKNGYSFIRMQLDFFSQKILTDSMKSLCYKVADERMHVGVNIADFVYNADLARSITLNYLTALPLTSQEAKSVMSKVNYYYNNMIFYTVQHYYDLYYNKIVEQKNFIEETHKDRLTILGQMSASFVHEFRNPLTSIIGFVKLLQQEQPNLPYLDIMGYELEQLNFRISQFLHVSRKDHTDELLCHPFTKLFNEIYDFLYPSLLANNTELIYDIKKDCYFFGNINEMKQVIINILMNSIDALESITTNKKIFVDVSCDGKEITISIANNGPQISKERIMTIFEPFVTTKKLGTGIGLFVCKQIVEKHNGTISCISNSLVTSFIIKLPFIQIEKSGEK